MSKKEYKILGRTKTIYRVVKSAENPYIMIDRRPIDNANLSFKAKGILTYLMRRPDGWEVSVSDLINHATDGEDSVRSGMKELQQAGHMTQTKVREKGRITGWLIEVYEIPHAVFPDVVLPDVENPTQVLKNLSNNELKRIRQTARPHGNSKKNDKSSSFVENVSDYWLDMTKEKPTRTLRTVFKRVFSAGVNCNTPIGQIKTDVIDAIDTTFLNKPKYPENYLVVCLRTLQETYERLTPA